MREGLRCVWVRTSRELEQLVPAWRELWDNDADATPFQSPEWLVPWWHAFGADLRTVALYRDDALIGLVPFYLYREPHTGERQLLPLGVGTSDYLDGVFSPCCEINFVRSAVDMLLSEDDWDTFRVSQMPARSRLLRALESSMRRGDERIHGESCSRMPAMTIPELPQKLRRNIMYYRNRAERAGRLELELADASNWSGIFDALIELHADRWQSRGESGVFADERVVWWHRECLPLLERAGLLRLCALRQNGDFLAVIYSLVDPPRKPHRTQYIYVPGFSLAHADLRPGWISTALVIEHAHREGVEIIDMLRGDEQYKKLWHAEPSPTFGFVRHRGAFREAERRTEEIAA